MHNECCQRGKVLDAYPKDDDIFGFGCSSEILDAPMVRWLLENSMSDLVGDVVSWIYYTAHRKRVP
jgi:hypothetical protein